MKKNVEFASAIQVRSLQIEVDEVLCAVAKQMIEPGGSVEDWMQWVFVSDESSIADFIADEADLEPLAKELQLPDLRLRDLVYEVAAILQQRKRPH